MNFEKLKGSEKGKKFFICRKRENEVVIDFSDGEFVFNLKIPIKEEEKKLRADQILHNFIVEKFGKEVLDAPLSKVIELLAGYVIKDSGEKV